jgi:hypothetical protein
VSEELAGVPVTAGPGTVVRFLNPDHDWEGVIEANRRGSWNWRSQVRVRWTKGKLGDGRPLAGTPVVWEYPKFLGFRGECPDCGRPAWYAHPDNPYRQPGGWQHAAPGACARRTP